MKTQTLETNNNEYLIILDVPTILLKINNFIIAQQLF